MRWRGRRCCCPTAGRPQSAGAALVCNPVAAQGLKRENVRVSGSARMERDARAEPHNFPAAGGGGCGSGSQRLHNHKTAHRTNSGRRQGSRPPSETARSVCHGPALPLQNAQLRPDGLQHGCQGKAMLETLLGWDYLVRRETPEN